MIFGLRTIVKELAGEKSFQTVILEYSLGSSDALIAFDKTNSDSFDSRRVDVRVYILLLHPHPHPRENITRSEYDIISVL